MFPIPLYIISADVQLLRSHPPHHNHTTPHQHTHHPHTYHTHQHTHHLTPTHPPPRPTHPSPITHTHHPHQHTHHPHHTPITHTNITITPSQTRVRNNVFIMTGHLTKMGGQNMFDCVTLFWLENYFKYRNEYIHDYICTSS